jgi:hypothetical protein
MGRMALSQPLAGEGVEAEISSSASQACSLPLHSVRRRQRLRESNGRKTSLQKAELWLKKKKKKKEEENGLVDNPENQETRRKELRKRWPNEKRQIKEQPKTLLGGCDCGSLVSGLNWKGNLRVGILLAASWRGAGGAHLRRRGRWIRVRG